jgi:hypothetical protein
MTQKRNYFIQTFKTDLAALNVFIEEALKRSYDGSFNVNDIKNPHALSYIKSFYEEVSNFIKGEALLRVSPLNGVFRDQRGNKVPKKGHVHQMSEALFSAVTCLEGQGTWFHDKKTQVTQKGETLILVEPRSFETYPNKFKKPLLHGASEDGKKRLVFISSFTLGNRKY